MYICRVYKKDGNFKKNRNVKEYTANIQKEASEFIQTDKVNRLGEFGTLKGREAIENGEKTL